MTHAAECTPRSSVTLHVSRADAIAAEQKYRLTHSLHWIEEYMEWGGKFWRGPVLLVHGMTVETLTFKPKTKMVTKAVEEPDGEEPVITPVENEPKP
jgi:hypothetical protein